MSDIFHKSLLPKHDDEAFLLSRFPYIFSAFEKKQKNKKKLLKKKLSTVHFFFTQALSPISFIGFVVPQYIAQVPLDTKGGHNIRKT